MTTTKKTLAIFGAGTGLGAAVASRFGREGYRVALVARNARTLDERVVELKDSGIEAAAFPADLTNIAAIPALVQSIEDKLGPVDMALYAPATPEVGFVPAVELSAAKLEPIARLFQFAPIEVAHAVLPGMLARKSGAIVFGGGLSAIVTVPGWSGIAPAMAAARNFIFTLNAETKDKGVYAGIITIGAGVEKSATWVEMTENGTKSLPYPVLTAESLADEVWSLVTKRDRVEVVLPEPK